MTTKEEVIGCRHYITKSKRGHYTVTVKAKILKTAENGLDWTTSRVLYREGYISSLAEARRIADFVMHGNTSKSS